MMLVKFCYIEKTGRYVGWSVYNNGTYYSSGDTLDKLLKNLGVNLRYRCNIHEVTILDTKPSPQSEIPISVMSKMFVSENILDKHARKTKKKKAAALKLLDRETLENNLRAMAEKIASEEAEPVAAQEEVAKTVLPTPSADSEYDYKVVEDENGKRLVIFELVKVAEWKLAK